MPRSNPAAPPRLDEADIAALRGALLGFYDAEKRDLPWRRTRDPYAIWISEVMAQQTRVETVVPYWHAWMEAYPDVESLAAAAEASVLKSWEGLGYYSRARNLHQAAKLVREAKAGRLPGSREELRALPGVGAYTAGAVASIAFGEVVPAVDGNVRRVASRILEWPEPTSATLEAEAARWVPEERPGDFNQALMELGATVCTPRSPRCGECPVAARCRALAAGTVTERPRPRKRARVRVEEEQVTVAWRPALEGIEFAMRQRPAEGLLGGMYEFPGVSVEGEDLRRATPQAPTEIERALPDVRHTFSHIRMTYRPVLRRRGPGANPPAGTRWVGAGELEDLPLPVAQQAILAHAKATLAHLGVSLDGGPVGSQ